MENKFKPGEKIKFVGRTKYPEVGGVYEVVGIHGQDVGILINGEILWIRARDFISDDTL